MGGASSSAGAASSAAGAGSQGIAQQYMQKYGYNPYELSSKYVQSAFDNVGQGIANQRYSYSPELNKPTFNPYNFSFGAPQNSNIYGGGLFSGTNFTNSTQR